MRFSFLKSLLALALITVSSMAQAQSAPFEHGWTLDGASSDLRFTSVKKGDVAETSSFVTLSGGIDENGAANIEILLDSVDTKIDLRNVRMRFLFFETFLHPTATITAQLDPTVLSDLETVRSKVIPLTFTMTLRDVSLEKTTDVIVTLIDMDRVQVAATTPLTIPTSEFDLETGRMKLEEAANVAITPLGIVSFHFTFDRTRPGQPANTGLVVQPTTPANAALETSGDFDREACVGRFEILSRTGNIYFGSGSARLDPKSMPLLDNLFDVVDRCPDLTIEIGGHTDSDGSAEANQALSQRRAQAVADYLAAKGVGGARMVVVGYGESQPFVENSSRANKARNRRIEFAVVN
ncbi:MAG: OmpA family protein [Paracoccaceae bacterium]